MVLRKNKLVGILGYGEIGRAVGKFYKSFLIRDVDVNQFAPGLDVLHVCLPFIKNFNKVVSENIKTYRPRLVIIHSTVGPGVTKKLYEKFGNVVHSPVRGVHPVLYEGIKTFVKYVGADNKKLGQEAVRYLRSLGIKRVKLFLPSVSTELGKLFDTTYYGLCIAYHAYTNSICKKVGANFDDVMTEFNKTYNEGYKKLGKNNVIRPVLFYPADNKIGGHCVVPNAEILKKEFGSDEILGSILRHK